MLLAGTTGQGVETAVYAAELDTHSYTRLALLRDTNHLTAISRDNNGGIHLLADTRGNSQAPHPFLLRMTLFG